MMPAGSASTTRSNSRPLAWATVSRATGESSASARSPGTAPGTWAASSAMRAAGAMTARRPSSAEVRPATSSPTTRATSAPSPPPPPPRTARGRPPLPPAVLDVAVEHLAPGPGPGRVTGLGDVSDDGERLGRDPPHDHPPGHGRQLLGLVHDDVPVGPGAVGGGALGGGQLGSGVAVAAGDRGRVDQALTGQAGQFQYALGVLLLFASALRGGPAQ